VEDRLADYERWREERAGLVARGAQPSVRLQTATAWAADAARMGIDEALLDVPPGQIEVVSIPGADKRPRGPRFGTLVHAILATVPLDASREVIDRTAESQSRILGEVSAGELHAAVVIVDSVLRHELFARARAARSVRRETPISWLHRDGTLIEGVLDLAFDEGDRTIVVDFKTDYELAAGETRYRAQLLQYVNAVARATGRKVTGVLLRV
jgi:ATP-dependent exoDNAse (exonuclease V) beta subunit